MKTLNLIRNIFLLLIAAIAIIVVIMSLSGFSFEPCLPAAQYPGEDGNLAIVSSGGVQVASIPVLGYIVYALLTLPGKIIAGLIILGLLATFIPFGKKKDAKAAEAKTTETKAEETPAAAAEELVENSQMEEIEKPAEEPLPDEPVVLDVSELEPEEAPVETPAAEVLPAETPVEAEPPIEEFKEYAPEPEAKAEEPVAEKPENGSFISGLFKKNKGEDVAAKLASAEEMQKEQAEKIEALTTENTALQEELASLKDARKKDQEDLETAKRAAVTLNSKAKELSGMLQKALNINKEIDNKNKETTKQLNELIEAFEKGNKQYDSLYKRYSAVLDYLQNKDMASKEACEREKKTFAR